MPHIQNLAWSSADCIACSITMSTFLEHLNNITKYRMVPTHNKSMIYYTTHLFICSFHLPSCLETYTVINLFFFPVNTHGGFLLQVHRCQIITLQSLEAERINQAITGGLYLKGKQCLRFTTLGGLLQKQPQRGSEMGKKHFTTVLLSNRNALDSPLILLHQCQKTLHTHTILFV